MGIFTWMRVGVFSIREFLQKSDGVVCSEGDDFLNGEQEHEVFLGRGIHLYNMHSFI